MLHFYKNKLCIEPNETNKLKLWTPIYGVWCTPRTPCEAKDDGTAPTLSHCHQTLSQLVQPTMITLMWKLPHNGEMEQCGHVI